MPHDRRQFLQFGLNAIAYSTLLSACASQPVTRQTTRKVAIFLPLTGSDAEIGTRSNDAITARLTRAGIETQSADTGSTIAQAQKAYRGADMRRVDLFIGPLYSDQVAALRAVSPARVPILSLSNDITLARQNVFVLGITPEQRTRAVLRYARRQGVRQIALLSCDDAWSTATIREANKVADEYGLTLSGPRTQSDTAVSKAEAVLFTGNRHDRFAETVDICRQKGQQILGTGNWLALPTVTAQQLEGAWFAGANFANSQTYKKVALDQMMILSAVSEDAARLAVQRLSTPTPTSIPGGFFGRLGNQELLPDGRVLRDMSILTFSAGQPHVIANVGIQASNV